MNDQKDKSINSSINFITFNQDFSLVAVGLQKGFSIFSTYPMNNHYRRETSGGIGIIELLERCNIMCLVGGGTNPQFDPQKVIVWNDSTQKIGYELSIPEPIKAVRMKETKIFVLTEQKIYIYEFFKTEVAEVIETFPNPNAIFGFALNSKVYIIAYPTKDKAGHVTVRHQQNQKCVSIQAHNGKINCLAMNDDGSLLSTASDKGTVIRIFDAQTGKQVQEVRRGSDYCSIHYMVFNSDSSMFLCNSNRGTIHLFNLKNKQDNQGSSSNQKSYFGKLANMIGVKNEYLNSEWSFAQYKIPEHSEKAICCFGPENTIIVVTETGMYYQAAYDKNSGGQMSHVQKRNMFDISEDKIES